MATKRIVPPTATSTIAAIYARVSTQDKGQDTDNQLHQLREYCARQGWSISEEYV
ncbi:MAG: recombinase family protein, partial [Acidobacteriota bacterium]|nr:recombinase family protein [Acidobacteriota bacterium]